MASCAGLLQVPVFAIMALTAWGVTTTAGQSCPAAFPDRLSTHNNVVYCFYISFLDNRKERFDAAQDVCRSIGGTLAEPRNSDIDTFLRNRMIQENLPGVNRYYISADDRRVDGEWRWLSDNALVSSGYTRWAPGVSSNPRNAECVVYASNLDYHWTNFQCMASNNFICQLGPIVETPEWFFGPWSPCSVTCGTGYRIRRYNCQFRNGTSGTCYGRKPSDESEACSNPPCIVERPEWVLGPWSPCSVTCGTGYRSRTYNCEFRNGTSGTCSGRKPSDESEACNNPPCIERPEWVLGPWSPCSATCGTGYRSRTYNCEFRNGTFGTCSSRKPSDEPEACKNPPCIERPEWVLGPWSPCSVTCGTGYRSRTYNCEFRNGTSGTCSGQKPSDESEACNNPPCIERPEWVVGPWSPCSATCGTGYRTRTYNCEFRNGTSGTCSGQKPSDESEACNNPPCIVERPEWVLGPWSSCSATCGTGYRYRTYYCQFRNGTSGTCSGPKPSDEYEACNKPPCNGGTGPLCGRPRRHCLSTASCDESSNQCVCPGSMQGDATFQCIPQDCQRCTVELDPLVISWNRLASVHMNLPCKFRMARVVTPIIGGATQTYSKCRVEVLVANSQDLDKQILFAQEVTVVVDFVGNDAAGNLVVSPVGPVSFYVNMLQIDSQPGNPWSTNSTVRNGVLMLTRFDINNQIAILDIPQCKVQVGFRVFNISKCIQTMKPGVFLAVSAGAIVDETAGFCACGQLGGDPDKFVQMAMQLGLEGPATAFLYQTLLDPLSANTNTGFWSDQCSALHSTVANCGTDRRSRAFNLCNRIVNRRMYLKCLKGTPADPLVVFNQCLTFACQGDTAACNSYMTALTQGRCPLTPRMRSVGCDPSRL